MAERTNDSVRALADGASASGSVNHVTRQGDTVRRPAGPWTAAVHATLRHLEEHGFQGVPRVLGPVEDDIETLSYLPGEVAKRPWPAVLQGDRGLVDLGRFLLRLHEALAEYQPDPEARWRNPAALWRPGDIIRHGDLGPWNIAWTGDQLVGFIDWDFAEPGSPLDDLAQLAWYSVPLRPPAGCEEAGVASGEEQHRRLEVLCGAYGAETEAVLDALMLLQRREQRLLRDLGGAGLEPWAGFFARGDDQSLTEDIAWLGNFREA